MHEVAVLENDFHNLRWDINLPLNLPRIEQVSGKMAKMTKIKKLYHPLSDSSWTCTTKIYTFIVQIVDFQLYLFSLLDMKSCTAQNTQSPLKMPFNGLKREQGSPRGGSAQRFKTACVNIYSALSFRDHGLYVNFMKNTFICPPHQLHLHSCS